MINRRHTTSSRSAPSRSRPRRARTALALATVVSSGVVPLASGLTAAAAERPTSHQVGTALHQEPCQPGTDAQNIVNDLHALAQQMQALQAPANSITIVNGSLLVIGQGPYPQIIGGLSVTVATASANIGRYQGLQPFGSDCDAQPVQDAYQAFVAASQATLTILTGKSGIAMQIPFVGPPMAAVLRQVQSADDALAASMLETIAPSRADQMKTAAANLDTALQSAVSAYSPAP